MTNKEMFMALTGHKIPKGELKEKMFEFHNKRFGKSKYVRKEENPKTFCGSCIQRVKAAVWKIYHSDEYRWSYDELVFQNKLGIHNQPIYKIDKTKIKK